MTSDPGIEPGPHWWKASALTTAPTLLPKAFLFDLLPSQVFQRTHYSLRSSINFSVFATRSERFRNSFFPCAIALWNELSTKLRNIESIGSFRKELKIYFFIVPYNILFDFSIDRYSPVVHTRLRLDEGLNGGIHLRVDG